MQLPRFALIGVAVLAMGGCNGGEESGPQLNSPSPTSCGDIQSQWVAAWGAGLLPLDGPIGESTEASAVPVAATVRNIVRVAVGGSQVRIRLSNAESTDRPLTITSASVARLAAIGSPALVPDSSRALRFGCQDSVTLPPGTQAVYSDPLDFPVTAGEILAISLHLPDAANPPAASATWNTSYVTADGAGDRTRDEDGTGFAPFTTRPQQPPGTPLYCGGCKTYALTGVDVISDEATGSIVLFGSSTFHGYNSTQDGFDDVTQLLAQRVTANLPLGNRLSAISVGVGGDTLHAGLARLERDVLSRSSVRAVIVYNVNDLGPALPGMETRAVDVQTDYVNLVAQAHARGVRVYCPTWPPALQSLQASLNGERAALNAWLFNSGTCDDVVDWDEVLRDPLLPLTYRPQYFSDGIHPNPAGHRALAESTPMAWLSAR